MHGPSAPANSTVTLGLASNKKIEFEVNVEARTAQVAPGLACPLPRSAEPGMLYQFVGDEVVGVFGLHRPPVAASVQALTCVRSLFAAGTAVSQAWQRELDRSSPR